MVKLIIGQVDVLTNFVILLYFLVGHIFEWYLTIITCIWELVTHYSVLMTITPHTYNLRPLLPFGSRLSLFQRVFHLNIFNSNKYKQLETGPNPESYISSTITKPYLLLYTLNIACESRPTAHYICIYWSNSSYVVPPFKRSKCPNTSALSLTSPTVSVVKKPQRHH